LEVAACIGNQFDLRLFAEVLDQPLEQLASTLWGPIREGFIAPSTDGSRLISTRDGAPELPGALAPCYRFAHDRVQQAAYLLMEGREREAMHLRIGRALLRAVPTSALDETVCAIVDQFNRALSQIDPREHVWLAELNYKAGRRAIGSAAY